MRFGGKYWHPPDRESGAAVHTLQVVYKEMLRQVCRDYSGLPDFRTLELSDIRFFYEGVRDELEALTKPR